MARIVLTTGEVVEVDKDDFDRLNKHKWGLTNGYPTRMTRVGDRQRKIRMHREIMGHPKGEVDHIDRDRLNARRANLRVVSRQENAINRKGWGKSGIKNVRQKGSRFVGEYRRSGKLNHVGYYSSPEEASDAVKSALGKMNV